MKVLVYCHPSPPLHEPPLNEHGLVDMMGFETKYKPRGDTWNPHWWKHTMKKHCPDIMAAEVHYVDPAIPPWYEHDELGHTRDGFAQDFIDEFAGQFDCVFMPDCGYPFGGKDAVTPRKDAVGLCEDLIRCMDLLAPGGKLVASKFINREDGVKSCMEDAGFQVDITYHDDVYGDALGGIMVITRTPQSAGGFRNVTAMVSLALVTVVAALIQ